MEAGAQHDSSYSMERPALAVQICMHAKPGVCPRQLLSSGVAQFGSLITLERTKPTGTLVERDARSHTQQEERNQRSKTRIARGQTGKSKGASTGVIMHGSCATFAARPSQNQPGYIHR